MKSVSSTTVTKIILPCAGLAKRLRPLTNRIPKALVPLNGKPLIAYMLREAEASGIMEAIIVASPQHKPHFQKYIAAHSKDFPGIRKIHLRIQKYPLGDGHAVLQAAYLFGSGPVAVRFADDIIISEVPVLTPLIAWHMRTHAPVLLLERVPKAMVSRYGIVETGNALAPIRGVRQGKAYRLKSFVEKPPVGEAPSRLAVMGGYILTPAFLSKLKRTGKSLNSKQHDALRLADIFSAMLRRGDRVYGYEFSGTKLDCGSLEGFARAEQFVRRHDA
jgi:UTP--glucose-1-phosphate uridylyltransferase